MAVPAATNAGKNSNRPAGHSTHRWTVLGACFAINFLSSALFRNAALFYPSIMDTFLVSREKAALPLFVYGGCFHLGALLGGAVIHVLTVRTAAISGGLLLSATFIASTFAPGTVFLAVVLGILGGAFRDTWGSYNDLFFVMASALIVGFALFAGLLAWDIFKRKTFVVSRQ
ncbi:uncharacterized protein LOC144119412 isoform X6 [Amblyomma americanum]